MFWLVAEDVGAYGQDIGTNIASLLSKLLSSSNDSKLLLGDFNPKYLIKYFPELYNIFIKYSKNIAYIGLPVQSGSDRILGLMQRGYTTKNLISCLSKLRKALPNIDLRTHIIIGFPGETERDFFDTLQFLKTIRFNLVTLYRYSDRTITPAANFPHKVSETAKIRRAWKTIRVLPPGHVIFTS